MIYQLKVSYILIARFFLIKALQCSILTDTRQHEILSRLPDFFKWRLSLGLGIRPIQLQFKEGQAQVYDEGASHFHIQFKNFDTVFRLFSGAMSFEQCLCQHRLEVRGDVAHALEIHRLINHALEFLVPKMILKRLLKRDPESGPIGHFFKWLSYGLNVAKIKRPLQG